MLSEVAKWQQTAAIAWTERMAYKLNFLLTVIAPSIVFYFVKFNLWSSIYTSNQTDTIGQYSLDQMLQYQAWVLIVSFLAQGYNSMALAEDIRFGRISAYLLYPFAFWKFHTARFLSLQFLQEIVALFTLLILFSIGLLGQINVSSLIAGLALSLFVGILWFLIQFLFGLIAFWLEQTWVLRALFMTCANFLSGAVIPLELYPPFFTKYLNYSPFPYLTYVPVQVFAGTYSGDLLNAFSIVLIWILVLICFTSFTWQRGIRLYSAAGI